MKSVIRIALLAIVAVGAISSFATSKTAPVRVSHQVTSSAMPMPMCPIDDPNACGFR